MSRDLLKSNLVTLERKINLLINDRKSMKEEVALLQSENEQLRSQVKEREEQIANFQNQIKISKIVNEMDTDGGDSPELKEKIDEYIKEIDKCLAHLSK
ncbi:MAG: hypothetical protein AAFN93_10205 [Bacteroidota bacterium]